MGTRVDAWDGLNDGPMPDIEEVPPKYIQIANHLRDRIASGDLSPGSEIPSERSLAEEWGVARPTVTKALDVLRRERYVTSRQGSGTFVRHPDLSIEIHAQVYPLGGTHDTYGITCLRMGCKFRGWGSSREQVMHRVAEHAEHECPWVPRESEES